MCFAQYGTSIIRGGNRVTAQAHLDTYRTWRLLRGEKDKKILVQRKKCEVVPHVFFTYAALIGQKTLDIPHRSVTYDIR